MTKQLVSDEKTLVVDKPESVVRVVQFETGTDECGEYTQVTFLFSNNLQVPMRIYKDRGSQHLVEFHFLAGPGVNFYCTTNYQESSAPHKCGVVVYPR